MVQYQFFRLEYDDVFLILVSTVTDTELSVNQSGTFLFFSAYVNVRRTCVCPCTYMTRCVVYNISELVSIKKM